VNVTYQTFVPLKGEPVVNKTIVDFEVDMSTGFFDKPGTLNCSLNSYTLTKVTDKENKEIEKSKWEKMFVFQDKKLIITEYAGSDIEIFESVHLLF
jgi:hypothetical protein